MRVDVRRLRFPARPLLVWDALFELAVGLALLVPLSPARSWLLLPDRTSSALGIVFLVAAAGIAALLLQDPPSPTAVRALGWGNLLGGAAGWLLLIVLWSRFSAYGRASLGSAADICLLLGVLELLSTERPR